MRCGVEVFADMKVNTGHQAVCLLAVAAHIFDEVTNEASRFLAQGAGGGRETVDVEALSIGAYHSGDERVGLWLNPPDYGANVVGAFDDSGDAGAVTENTT